MSLNSKSVTSTTKKVNAYYDSVKKGGKKWWQAFEVTGKKKLSLKLAQDDEKEEGLVGLREFLSDKKTQMYRILLRTQSEDGSGSTRQKYFYIRYTATGAPVMVRTRLTPLSGEIDGCFSTKHASLNIDETDVEDDLTMAKLVDKILRVGGAHKPDHYVFGNSDADRYSTNALDGDKKKEADAKKAAALAKADKPKTKAKAKKEEAKEEPKKDEEPEKEEAELSIDDPAPAEDAAEEAADKAEEVADKADENEEADKEKEEELSIDK